MSHFAKIRFLPFVVLDRFDHLAAVVKRALSQLGFWGVWSATVVALAVAAECSTLAAAPKGRLTDDAMSQAADGAQHGSQIPRSIFNFSYTEPAAGAPARDAVGAPAARADE